jgi:hypothetical protein
MRTWILALLLHAAVNVGDDRATETSSQYVRRAVAAAARPIPLPDSGQQLKRETVAECCAAFVLRASPCGDTCIETITCVIGRKGGRVDCEMSACT